MKRIERMKMVQQVVETEERRGAERLAISEKRLAECESKLTELESYHANYGRRFSARAGVGIGGAGLRDFQTFLARLGEAVRQQAQLLFRARAERDSEHRNWQGAAQRAEALGRMLKRWQTEEQHKLDRHEQREADEHSQRKSKRGIDAHGA